MSVGVKPAGEAAVSWLDEYPSEAAPAEGVRLEGGGFASGVGGVVKIGTLRFGHLGLRLEFLLHGFPLLGLVRHS